MRQNSAVNICFFLLLLLVSVAWLTILLVCLLVVRSQNNSFVTTNVSCLSRCSTEKKKNSGVTGVVKWVSFAGILTPCVAYIDSYYTHYVFVLGHLFAGTPKQSIVSPMILVL